MDFTCKYYKKGSAVSRDVPINNIGGWRSRWERKKETDVKNGFYIKRIETRRTDNDFMVTKVTGHNKNGEFFVITPNEEKPVKQSGGLKNEAVVVKQSKYCKDKPCKNYVRVYRKNKIKK